MTAIHGVLGAIGRRINIRRYAMNRIASRKREARRNQGRSREFLNHQSFLSVVGLERL